MRKMGLPIRERLRNALYWVIPSSLAVVALAAPAAAPAALPTVPLDDCAPAADLGTLAPGDQAIGFTVRQGSTPEPFDAEILDVWEDGLAPGRDLVVIKASGQPIDDGGGISAGMSGSPLYTLDGELIGSVSYGFAYSPSPIGGVTPAAESMLPLLDEPGSLTSAAPRTLPLSKGRRARIARRADLSSTGSALDQLRLPITISGGMAAQHRRKLERVFAQSDQPLMLAGPGGSSSSALAPTGDLDPGDAFFAGLSYGDITSGALGTATYVCDDQALAFGHPFSFTGKTFLGASEATVSAIIKDDVYGSFKLGRPTDAVGIVDLDRLGGIRSQLGVEIPTIEIEQDTVVPETGRSHLGGTTNVVAGTDYTSSELPWISAIHVISNIDSTFDQISGGSADVGFKLNGVDPAGHPWSLSRDERFTSRYDISPEPGYELLIYTALLSAFFDRGATIEHVNIDAEVDTSMDMLRIGKVLWAAGDGKLRSVHTMTARAGQIVHARVPLKSSTTGKTKFVNMKFRMPASRRTIQINISPGSVGAGLFSGDFLFCVIFGECGSSDDGKSFKKVLNGIKNAPHTNDLLGTFSTGKITQTRKKRMNRVLGGGDHVHVSIVGGGKGSPEQGIAAP